jgi:uncharacterized protein (DUF1697 family)
MGVVIGLLRGVNVGGHHKVPMADLRALCESLKLRDARTYVQSGNVVFRTAVKELRPLAKRMEDALEKQFGFRPAVMLRTTSDFREVVRRNPFAKRTGLDPAKMVVSFLTCEPEAEAREKVHAMKFDPEEVRIEGCEMYLYFPIGIGVSKLSMAALDRALKVSGTARNWNSVTKVLALAEAMERGE